MDRRPRRRPRLIPPAALAALLLAAGLAGGCRADPPPPPQSTAAELNAQAEAHFVAGEHEAALEAFRRALALEDDPAARRELVVRFAAAGRADLAERLVAGREDAASRRLLAAVRAFRDDPLGRPDRAYLLPAMAEALRWAGEPADLRDLPRPVRLQPVHLAPMLHYWQAWVRLSQLEARPEAVDVPEPSAEPATQPGEAPPPPAPAATGEKLPVLAPAVAAPVEPARAMVVWVLGGPVERVIADEPAASALEPEAFAAEPRADAASPGLPALAEAAAGLPGFFVVHPAGRASGATAAHLASWRLAADGPAGDLAELAEGRRAAEVELHLAAWQGDATLSHLVLAGELEPDGFVVRRASDRALYAALEAALVDPDVTAAYVVPREGEREAISRLLARAAPRAVLVEQGAALTVAGDDAGDAVPPMQALADAALYVRYGRAAMGSASGEPAPATTRAATVAAPATAATEPANP